MGEQLLHKLKIYFHRHCLQKSEEEMQKDICSKLDAIITNPIAASNRTGMSRIVKVLTDEANMENDSVVEFLYF